MSETVYKKDNIVWVDMEMTGLKTSDRILEIACVVTDKNLKVISNVKQVIIHQTPEILNNMNDWCMEHHTKTGLVEASLKSNINEKEAEQLILDFLKPYTVKKQNPLAGNSVYMDRLFLITYMPILNEYLHYRIIDVSTIKELCNRWNKNIFYGQPEKSYHHRGTEDILDSIKELSYYKNFMFTKNHK